MNVAWSRAPAKLQLTVLLEYLQFSDCSIKVSDCFIREFRSFISLYHIFSERTIRMTMSHVSKKDEIELQQCVLCFYLASFGARIS